MAIIACLIFSSIVAWSVMVSKAIQMRRAKKLNYYFDQEFHAQKKVLEMFDRKLQVEGCPLYMVYRAGCEALDTRLRGPGGERSKQQVSLKNMEHVKRAMENVVAQESLRLESGLILLAIAVSGAPFIGLLGTGVGRDEHVCGHRPAGKCDDGRNGSGRFSGARHDRGRPARGDSLDVQLQLAGS